MSSPSSNIDQSVQKWLDNVTVQSPDGYVDLLNICISLLQILRHDNEKLMGDWSTELFESVGKNLIYVRSKLIAILEKKRVIQAWGDSWVQFVKDIEMMLEQEHRDVSFRTKAMKNFLELTKENSSQPVSKLDALDEQEKLFEKYREYSLKYDYLVSNFSKYIDDVSGQYYSEDAK